MHNNYLIPNNLDTFSRSAYDTNQALVLCQLKQFDEGIVYLYEKTGMYTDILRFWMEKGGTDRVIEGVRRYG